MDFGTGYRIGKLSEEQRQQIGLQLRSYFQNSQLKMTKESYFEMCEMLGTDPKEEEIPIEFDDLIVEVQQALQIYSNLQDCWDYMGGNYIGKNLTGFRDVLEILEVPASDYRSVYELIMEIDRIRSEVIQQQKQQEKPH